MPDKPLKPTEAELAILRVLWQRGPSTVREVQEILDKTKKTGYTTVLKFMQIMAGKGLVARDESPYAHIYRAAIRREQVERTLVSHLLDVAFEGSASRLLQRVLSAKKATPEELTEIRKILNKHERDMK